MTTIYDFSAKRLDGTDASMATYRDQVLLIVNTASKCGFTPQYEGLETLQKTYGPRGFSVLGFPCNQFGSQEPGDAAAIGSFCQLTYDVTFPMFAKIEVNGEAAHPLYKYLKAAKPGLLGLQGIKWNFTKFLVDRSGLVMERFAPTTKPAAIAGRLEAILHA
jgi:glutathione peroxidase